MIKVTVDEKKGKLFIEADIEEGKPSASGKTIVFCSSRGNMKTDQTIKGKNVTIGFNCYTAKD